MRPRAVRSIKEPSRDAPKIQAFATGRRQHACADPESFFSGGPNFFPQIPLKSDHHRPASETPFAGVPMMAQH